MPPTRRDAVSTSLATRLDLRALDRLSIAILPHLFTSSSEGTTTAIQ